jgi:hypothetical protein
VSFMFAPQVVVNEVADGMDSGWNGNWCQGKNQKLDSVPKEIIVGNFSLTMEKFLSNYL